MIKDLPQIGLGTYLMKDKIELKGSIKAAIEAGYKHIDTAEAYGNEEFIGEIFQELNINRSELFITSKIHPFNYKYHTRKTALKILKKLKLSQIDLILLHVAVEPETNAIAYKELMKLRDEGKIRHIGVSNFTIERIEELKKVTGEYPYCNQIPLSPVQRSIGLEEFCKNKNILLTGFSIMIPYFEPNEVSGDNALKDNQKQELTNMASAYGKDVGQILNKWALQIGYHVIPKSKTPSRVLTNNKLYDFDLKPEDLQLINSWNLMDEKEYTIKKNSWAGKITEEKYKKGF